VKVASRPSWTLVRTALVLGGLGFVVASLAAACLDHYDENYGCAAAASENSGASGTTSPTANGADCGAPATGEVEAGVGSGSGSAEVP